MARHRKSSLVAARGYAALFRGEMTADALAAGMRLHQYVEWQIAFVEAHSKRR